MNHFHRALAPSVLMVLALGAPALAAPAEEPPAATPPAGEAPPAEEAPAAEPGDFPGDFDQAIDLFYDGEGGKKGIGMTKLWPRVSVPALSDAQLRKVLIGNTFRTPDMFAKEGDSIAFYMDPSGSVEAWFNEWDKQEDLRQCPKKDVRGDDFLVKDGVCHKRRFIDVAGKWEIRNNQLCPSLTWVGGSTDPCWYFVMLLNRVALFDTAGDMLGYEKTLTRGKALSKVTE
jgi:hypothetical protein